MLDLFEKQKAPKPTRKPIVRCPVCHRQCQHWSDLFFPDGQPRLKYTEKELIFFLQHFHPEKKDKPIPMVKKPLPFACPLCHLRDCPVLAKLLKRKFTDVERRNLLKLAHRTVTVKRPLDVGDKYPPWWGD